MGHEDIQRQAEDLEEEAEHKWPLVKQLSLQAYNFGLFLNLKATYASALALPWGVGAAGAAATKTFVDAGDDEGRSPTVLMHLFGTSLRQPMLVTND